MTAPNIGNALYQLSCAARASLFNQGELAQLTYGAFDVVANNVTASQNEVFEISLPIGYRPNRTPILSTRNYRKEELLARYQRLAFHQLPINGLLQLVTTIEALLGDIVRTVITRYPQKLGAKRTIALQVVLESKTLEDIHLRATDALLNELFYKSPAEFAEAVAALIPVNLLECPAFHKYIEIKATRDVFIHNRGTANETYARKAGSHARAAVGHLLPVDITYFLESYEYCLQLTEWLEVKLHEHWHSSELEASRNRGAPEPPQLAEEIAMHQNHEELATTSPPPPKVSRPHRKKASA